MRKGPNNCFALSEREGCTILKKTTCDYQTCTFYKTEEEKKETEKKAKRRCMHVGISYGATSGEV